MKKTILIMLVSFLSFASFSSFADKLYTGRFGTFTCAQCKANGELACKNNHNQGECRIMSVEAKCSQEGYCS